MAPDGKQSSGAIFLFGPNKKPEEFSSGFDIYNLAIRCYRVVQRLLESTFPERHLHIHSDLK